MAKFIKKSEVQYKNGYLVDKDGNVCQPDYQVVAQANRLECQVQRALYLGLQPKAVKPPTMDGYEFETEHVPEMAAIALETPVSDMQKAKTKRILEERAAASAIDSIVKSIAGYWNELANWVSADEYLMDDHIHSVDQFDCKYLGNPLDFDPQTLIWALALSDKDNMLSRPIAEAFIKTGRKKFFPTENFEEDIIAALYDIGFNSRKVEEESED